MPARRFNAYFYHSPIYSPILRRRRHVRRPRFANISRDYFEDVKCDDAVTLFADDEPPSGAKISPAPSRHAFISRLLCRCRFAREADVTPDIRRL